MRVKIDTSLCEGHAKCMDATEVVFDVRDDDLSHVLVDVVPTEEEANVIRAVRMCPRAAISVED